MRCRNKVVLIFCIALAITSPVSAQRHSVPVTLDEVGMTIDLQVSGQAYHFEGQAACQHAPVASIYNVMSEMWNLRQIDSRKSITLTLWHPRNTSGDMFSLFAQIGSKAYTVDTIKSGKGKSVSGSGNVSFTTSGPGGTFTINAKTKEGDVITGTVKCSAFSAPMAEGG